MLHHALYFGQPVLRRALPEVARSRQKNYCKIPLLYWLHCSHVVPITMPRSCPIVRARSKIMRIGAEFLIALAHSSVF